MARDSRRAFNIIAAFRTLWLSKPDLNFAQIVGFIIDNVRECEGLEEDADLSYLEDYQLDGYLYQMIAEAKCCDPIVFSSAPVTYHILNVMSAFRTLWMSRTDMPFVQILPFILDKVREYEGAVQENDLSYLGDSKFEGYMYKMASDAILTRSVDTSDV